MEVLKLMNTNPNWRDVLSADPYNIIIKEDGDYVLLKYSQIDSDFSLPIVRECRGSIFYKNGEWKCVRRAFDKFGNYGESYVSEINWGTASVQEKVDGSLMSLWYHNSGWHLSTNGTIDAFKAPLGDYEITFGDYFLDCLGNARYDFLPELDTDYCYTFEMVGPLNRVVVNYDKPKLYAIGQRNMKTMEEVKYDGPLGAFWNIWLPKFYTLNSLDEVIEVASKMSKDEEGFVVCDGEYNRIKVKSLEYLMAARLKNNGVITTHRIIQMIKDLSIDDFLAYCEQHTERVNNVIDKIHSIAERWEAAWYDAQIYAVPAVDVDFDFEAKSINRRNFALAIKKYGDAMPYLFRCYDGYIPAIEYILTLSINKIKSLINEN